MIDELKRRIVEWREDTNEKYQLEQTGTMRDTELATTLSTLHNVLQMIDQIKKENKIKEKYYGPEGV